MNYFPITRRQKRRKLLEGAIKKFWISKQLNLYTIHRAWDMYKQIDLGKIDLHIHFLRFMNTTKISLKPQTSLISPPYKVTR